MGEEMHELKESQPLCCGWLEIVNSVDVPF